MRTRILLVALLALALAVPAFAAAKGKSTSSAGRGAESVDSGSLYISGESSMPFMAVSESYKGGDIKLSQTLFDMSIRVGYFVIDGLSVGTKFKLDYNSNTIKTKGNKADDIIVTTVEFLPFVRYYFLQDMWFKPFLDGGFGVRYILTDTEGLDYGRTTFGPYGGGGIALFFVDRVSMDVGLGVGYGFGNVEYKFKGEDKEKESGGRLDFLMAVAFSVYFL